MRHPKPTCDHCGVTLARAEDICWSYFPPNSAGSASIQTQADGMYCSTDCRFFDSRQAREQRRQRAGAIDWTLVDLRDPPDAPVQRIQTSPRPWSPPKTPDAAERRARHQRAYMRNYRKAHQEEIKAKRRERAAREREERERQKREEQRLKERHARHAAYARNHREEKNESARLYRARHYDAILARRRDNYEQENERRRARYAARKAAG